MDCRGVTSAAPKSWGWWTVPKLKILEDYLNAFAQASKYRASERIYLDLFAGWPDNVSRETNEEILGSAHRALRAQPPFTRVCLFELGPKARRLETALREAYPGRTGLRVYGGDSNVQLAQALKDLREVDWAPTFAFIDQFSSQVHWSTLVQLARFRRAKTKAEMWILFATSMYPRGLVMPGGKMNADVAEAITRMLGTEEWHYIVEGRRRGLLSGREARDEWVNLMRWRLENELGYAKSHVFTMKNTSGHDLYDMIFTSDHEAGDRIMHHLYNKAASEHEEMRQHALALRRDRRAADRGEIPLFAVTRDMVAREAGGQSVYVHEPPHEPYRLPRR